MNTNTEIYQKILSCVAEQFCTTADRVLYSSTFEMRKARKVLYQVCAQYMPIDCIAFCARQRELAIKELISDESIDCLAECQEVLILWNK